MRHTLAVVYARMLKCIANGYFTHYAVIAFCVQFFKHLLVASLAQAAAQRVSAQQTGVPLSAAVAAVVAAALTSAAS